MSLPEESPGPQFSKCPRCAGPLAYGFLASQGRLNWVDHLGSLDVSPFKGTALIPMMSGVRAPHFRGWMCDPCGLLIVDFGSGILYTDKATIAKYDSERAPS